MRKWAELSPDGVYRYCLGREWSPLLGRPPVGFLLLNPSVADAQHDDATLRRLIGFARAWGYGSLEVVNLFAWRATDPNLLYHTHYSGRDIIGGPENDAAILASARRVSRLICGWGTHGELLDRGRDVAAMLRAGGVELGHLGLTKGGQPAHPLYLPRDLRPMAWEAAIA